MEERILIIAKNRSYLATSLEEKLKELSYQVMEAKADIDEVNRITEHINAVILYVDDEGMEDKSFITYIKDKIVMDDILFFLVGNEEEMQFIEQVIPKNLIVQKFQRPVNVNETVEFIDKEIQKSGNIIKKKILVVDDSGAMLWNVKGWLEDRYQVILANSGAMAIKYLTLNRPDLVLLDYEMPVVDGKQVLEMIRSEVEFEDIPVIFLTGRGDRESVMNVSGLKPDGYLLKTMEPKDIVQAVDDFFLKRKGKEI